MVKSIGPGQIILPSHIASWQDALLLKVKEKIKNSWDFPSCIFAILEENGVKKTLIVELEDLDFEKLSLVWKSFVESKKPLVALLVSLKTPTLEKSPHLYYELYSKDFKKATQIKFNYYPEFNFELEKNLNPQL